MLEKQAERYRQIFDLFKEYKGHITSVTFWGVADNYTWLDNFPVRRTQELASRVRSRRQAEAVLLGDRWLGFRVHASTYMMHVIGAVQ